MLIKLHDAVGANLSPPEQFTGEHEEATYRFARNVLV